MSYYEGILISSNKVINVSAAGAEIKEDKLLLKIYHPSDTSRNLDLGSNFTFSLTDDLELFYTASLKGHDEPSKAELTDEEIFERNGYYYPKKATKVYFCEVTDITTTEGKDEYGEYTIKRISAKINEEEGEEKYLTRDNPYLDSMVYASRVLVSNEEQRKKIKNKVKELLRKRDTDLAERITTYVEGEKK